MTRFACVRVCVRACTCVYVCMSVFVCMNEKERASTRKRWKQTEREIEEKERACKREKEGERDR